MLGPIRRFSAGPAKQQRLSLALILLGALLAALGAGLRVRAEGSGGNPQSYLLDTAGLLLAVGGALIQTRAADLIAPFDAGGVRRRAILLICAGIVALLLGCVAVSVPPSAGMLIRSTANGTIIAGIGLGLGGFFTLVWVQGGTYAGGRIDRLSDEDW